MTKSLFTKYLDRKIEKHLPITLMNFRLVMNIVNVLSQNHFYERRELLILAYVIGLDVNESNALLTISGHKPLYVKRREDAMWRYALNNRKDCNSIIREIFPENTDDFSEINEYNKDTNKRKENVRCLSNWK